MSNNNSDLLSGLSSMSKTAPAGFEIGIECTGGELELKTQDLLTLAAELFEEPEATCAYCKTPTHSLDIDSLCDTCSEMWDRIINETAEYAFPRAAECSSCGEYSAPSMGTFCKCCAAVWSDAIYEPAWDDLSQQSPPPSPPQTPKIEPKTSTGKPPLAPKKGRTGPTPRVKKFVAAKKLHNTFWEELDPCHGCGEPTDAGNGFCSRACLNSVMKED